MGYHVNAISEVERDESVVFFPSYGALARDGQTWRLRVRGCVFGPGREGLRRKFLMGLMRRALRADDTELGSELFQRRAEPFLASMPKRRAIAIRVGGKTYALKKRSRRHGHFGGVLRLSQREIDKLRHNGHICDGRLRVELVTRYHHSAPTFGHVELIKPHGVSIISDVDDTIKRTEVGCRRSMLTNTFLREFQEVDDMPTLYRDWADQGASFHYVSSSPWQLCEALAEWFDEVGLPAGAFHLRRIRLRDPSVMRLFVARGLGKFWAVRSILRAFPRRRFVLIGDSGERDPEIYGAALRRYPNRVAKILIRNVSNRPAHTARYLRAFRKLPQHKWQIFRDPTEIADAVF